MTASPGRRLVGGKKLHRAIDARLGGAVAVDDHGVLCDQGAQPRTVSRRSTSPPSSTLDTVGMGTPARISSPAKVGVK